MNSRAIQEILTNNLTECINFANRNNYVSTQNLDEIPNGTAFYEININNHMVSRKRVKTGTTTPLASHSLYIVTNDDLGPDSIIQSLPPPVTGGKRKSRRNRKKRKSRKNRRKSNRRRR